VALRTSDQFTIRAKNALIGDLEVKARNLEKELVTVAKERDAARKERDETIQGYALFVWKMMRLSVDIERGATVADVGGRVKDAVHRVGAYMRDHRLEDMNDGVMEEAKQTIRRIIKEEEFLDLYGYQASQDDVLSRARQAANVCFHLPRNANRGGS